MKNGDIYRTAFWKGYELEWIKTLNQTNVRKDGKLVRAFLSIEAAKRWIDARKVRREDQKA